MVEREIIYHKDYYHNFRASLPAKAIEKLEWALTILRTNDYITDRLVKHIRDGLYELRVSSYGNEYRVFFIFEANRIIVLFHGFQKKKQKTPKQEIDKALLLKKEYYEQRGK